MPLLLHYKNCTFFLPYSFSLSISLSLTGSLAKNWCLCSEPRNLSLSYARTLMRALEFILPSLTHSVRKEDGFFLFFFFLLLHPLTAAAAASAGHHPSSSSFASQPEHSGRSRGGWPSTDKMPFPASTPMVQKENPHATDPKFSCFRAVCPFLFALFTPRQKKKCCAHTHTLARTHTLFSSNFVRFAKKI